MPPELFKETVKALPGSGYVGANVTIPHKLAALELADEATPAARRGGAANALTFADGRLEATTPTPAGFSMRLASRYRRPRSCWAPEAGRAAVWALKEAGVDVAVWNRTAASEPRGSGCAGWTGPSPAELVVNATSVGMAGEDAAELLGLFEMDVLVELVYGDEPTPLERWAAGRGARVVAGREVLARQGARSLERWTGAAAPVDAMLAALSRSV